MSANYAGIGYGVQKLWDFTDKSNALQVFINQMLARTQSMFVYSGLPDTIPQRSLELLLQVNGYTGILKHGDSLYAMRGGLGGEPDPYYMPTIYTVANPALDYSANLQIHDEVVVIGSDSLYQGLMPLLRKYGTALLENDITMNMMSINNRVQALLSAGTDAEKEAAEKWINELIDGKLGAIGENAFLQGIRVNPVSAASSDRMTDSIEYHQYLRAGLWNELGLNANYNMKREAINSNESQMNRDALLPLVDDMLRCRKNGVQEVNSLFGTSITVELSSSWQDIQEEPAEEDPAEDAEEQEDQEDEHNDTE